MTMAALSARALDTGEICRFCLSEDGKFVSIFREDQDPPRQGQGEGEESEGLAVAARIMAITTVEVHEGDGLPELVCQRCVRLLDQAFQFRDQVERCDAVLRHHYGRLWPETNPQLQKLLTEDQVVKKNLNADFPAVESDHDQTEATCLVTLKQEQDELNDGSRSPSYEDDYDEPQDYTMDDDEDEVDGDNMEPEDLTERPSGVTPPYNFLDNLKSVFQEQQEPISLALRETQNTSAPKVQPSPLTIPNVSVSLIRKNNIAREAQAQAQAQAQSQSQSKSRRWRKTNEPCTICGKCFKDRFAMKVHLRTHSGEKPFVCMVCGKAFRQKAHLGKHSYTHSAQRKPHPQSVPGSQRSQQGSPQSQASNRHGANSSSPLSSSNSYASPADVKARLARLSTIIQAKPPSLSESQPITVPIPILPRIQRQGMQGPLVSPPRPTTPPSEQGSPSSPSQKAQTEPLSLVPKTEPLSLVPKMDRLSPIPRTQPPPIIPKAAQPLMLSKPMLTVPQITPKAAQAVSNTSPSALAFYVMANGLLPPNVVVGNGPGLKKT